MPQNVIVFSFVGSNDIQDFDFLPKIRGNSERFPSKDDGLFDHISFDKDISVIDGTSLRTACT